MTDTAPEVRAPAAPAPAPAPDHSELRDLAERARSLYCDEIHDRIAALVRRL